MLTLITGGAASGKSEYAEKLALRHGGHKFYLATMHNDGSESAQYRIRRHRKLREGKGFETIECSSHLEQVLGRLQKIKTMAQESTIEDFYLPKMENMVQGNDGGKLEPAGGGGNAVILLEDLPNLLANEMFSDSGEPYRAERILAPLWKLASSYDIVVVSANVFEDGGDYDEGTERYIRNLAELHSKIAESPYCEDVTEVVCGIPVPCR